MSWPISRCCGPSSAHCRRRLCTWWRTPITPSTCARRAGGPIPRCWTSWRGPSPGGLSGRSAIRRADRGGPPDRGRGRCVRRLWLGSHGDEQASFGAQAPHPRELRHRALDRPVVFLREELVRRSAQERAGERPEVGEPAGAKPGAHLAQRVAVLLDVLVLVAQPGLSPRRLALALGEDRIAGHPTVSREPRDQAARAQG